MTAKGLSAVSFEVNIGLYPVESTLNDILLTFSALYNDVQARIGE